MCVLQSILHVLYFYPSEAHVRLSRLFHYDPLKLLITERMFHPVFYVCDLFLRISVLRLMLNKINLQKEAARSFETQECHCYPTRCNNLRDHHVMYYMT